MILKLSAHFKTLMELMTLGKHTQQEVPAVNF